jgi:putative addiction module component (TIGR02574 family)
MTREAILKEALLLPSEDRMRLLDDLWQSFANDEQALALTPAQAEDLKRRIAEDDAGLSNPQPWEVVRERLLKRS